MILPPHLIQKFRADLGFYSCTVSNFEQYTLARFLRDGYFEKHINRMRKYYKNQRDTILSCIRKNPRAADIRITEENAGLHFLIHFPSSLTDDEIIQRADQYGIRISALSQYDLSSEVSDKNRTASSATKTDHTLVVNYSGLDPETIPEAVDRLIRSIAD